MRCIVLIQAVLLVMSATFAQAQNKLSTKWEELIAGDFKEAIAKARGTCLLPFGILEKHGPHLPLGTDLLNVRYVAEHAAQQEYAIIFPEYFAGQIFEAKSQPGTIAYSPELQLQLLQETTDENGAQRLQEGDHHQWPRRQRTPPPILRADATLQASRLCRVRPVGP